MPDPLYHRLRQPETSVSDLAATLTRLGDLHRERGELSLAADAYDAALAHGPSGLASLGRGLVAMMRGEPAATCFQDAYFAFQAENQTHLLAMVEGNLAAVALGEGQAEEARSHCLSALARLHAAELPADPIIRCNLARSLVLLGDRDGALAELALAEQEANTQSRPGLAGLASLARGDIFAEIGETSAATACYKIALSCPLASGDRARALLGLGGTQHRAGDLAGATAALEQALPLLRQSAPIESWLVTLINLGGLHYANRDPARAAALLDEASALLPPALRDTPTERRLRHNRGLALISTGRLAEAEPELLHAIALARAVGTPDELAAALGARGDLLRFAGRLEEAIAVQQEIVGLNQTSGVRVRESGLMYTPVEDRSLNISTASLRRHRDRRGPVLLIAPAAHGATGPLFPRGAVSVGSFLQHHGIPAVVLPLAHYAEPHLHPAEAARRAQDAVRDAMSSLNPRAVGISVTFSYLYPDGQAVAAAVRALDPAVPILIGGPHVTYQDAECLQETPAIDIVIRGEGEWTALELIRTLDAGGDLSAVQGITWRAPDGAIVKNPKRALGNVLDLPPEDFGMLPAAFTGIMDITALTSRGCAYRCRFCHEFRYWGGVVREHPVQRVIDELDRLASFGNTLQGIDDSMLDMRTPFFHELVAALGKSPHVSPNFGLLSRLDTITEEGAAAMRAAGMRWVCVGVESGSQKVLDSMNKAIQVEQIRAGLELARRGGLSASGFLIVGHPGDNAAESERTRDFVRDLFEADLINWLDLSTFSPYPGTPFYNNPERHGVEILTRDWSLWRRTNRPVAQLTDYSSEEIYLNLLSLLAVQSHYVRGQAPPALGSGSGAGG